MGSSTLKKSGDKSPHSKTWFNLPGNPDQPVLSDFKVLFGACVPEKLDEGRDQTRPTSLMAGTDTCAVVSMEVFVEEYIVSPVRVCLELLRASEYWTSPVLISKKDAGEA